MPTTKPMAMPTIIKLNVDQAEALKKTRYQSMNHIHEN